MSPSKRSLNPLTTWHSQGGILWISWTWGLSYVVPKHYRIPFSEVFPEVIDKTGIPMWVWGVLLLLGASVSLGAEQALRHTRFRPWRWAAAGHMLLAGVYSTLAMAALVQGVVEVKFGLHLECLFNIISTISRPVLWGVVAYLHTTFARMPHVPDVAPRERQSTG